MQIIRVDEIEMLLCRLEIGEDIGVFIRALCALLGTGNGVARYTYRLGCIQQLAV